MGVQRLASACIDDNLEMVEFLVQKGADVNRKDNEGWTPLHATASCGFLSIARYLIENGTDLASINSDGELAVDLASSDAMEDLIQHHLDEQGIDCEEARKAEERIMLSDATKWLRTDSSDCDKAHPKTGATAIHVAAAKGYIGVLKLLLEGRGDIDRQDVDGWTPLHAAAYWGQKEATQMLLNASADIDIQNYSGQLAIDIAQDDIVPLLKDARKNGKRTKRRPPSHGNRITDNFENSTETPTKVIRVEVKPIDSNKEKEVGRRPVAVGYDDDGEDDVAETQPEPAEGSGEREGEEETDEKDEEEEEETMDDTVDEEELEEEVEVEEEEQEEEEEEEEEQEQEVAPQEPKRVTRSVQDVTDSSIVCSVPHQHVTTTALTAQISQPKDAASEEEEEEEEEEEDVEENGSVSSEPYSSSNPSADSSLTESETGTADNAQLAAVVRCWNTARVSPCGAVCCIPPTGSPKPRVTDATVLQPSNAASTPAATATASNPPPPTAPWRRQRAIPTPVPRQFYEDEQQPAPSVSRVADDVVDYANLYFASNRNRNRYAELRARIQANINNNNNSSNTNNNSTTTTTTTTTSTTTTTASMPASNISSYLVQRSASLKDHRTLRKTTSNLVLGSTTISPTSATGPVSGATTNLVPTAAAATGTGAVVSQAANNTTGSAASTPPSGAVSPPTSPSGTPTTTPTAGQIRSSIPTPITSTNNHKNTLSTNTDNSSGTPFGDRYRKRYEDQSELVRKPVVSDDRPTSNVVEAGQHVPPDHHISHETTLTPANGTGATDMNKNHSLSFVPPTRDEESETQRKAHAKRVRETRRSTQGVTLDEIKSAEQLVKKKNATGTGNQNDIMASATTTTTTTTTASSSPPSLSSTASPSFNNDRVPSVGGTSEQQTGNHVPEGPVVKEADNSGSKAEEIAVSASFTIAAPGSSSLEDGGDGGGGHRRHRRSVSGMDGEEDDSKVTVSYTISAPVRQSSPSARVVSNSKEGAEPLDGTVAGDVPVVSATFHVPAVVSDAMVATSATIRTSGAAGGVVSNSDSNTTTTTTITNTTSNNSHTSASSNTNYSNTAATYTKRSLFDIDNANSLTLAEKLRHEANKYAIAAVADGELDGHPLSRVPTSNSTTNSGGESHSTGNSGSSTNAPADNSAVSVAGAAGEVPPSPTLRKADTTAATTTGVTAERRPSWRLKVDGGSKFKLEDASTPNTATQSSSVAGGESSVPASQAPEHGLTTTKLTSSSALAQRRAQQQQNGDSATTITGTTGSSVASSRPLSASAGLAAGEQYNRVPGSAAGEPTGVNSSDTSPLHLRRPPKSAGEENKENDKENDSRSTAQATQAVIQRRRRQKRRSTGVVSVGMEDLDLDRQDSPVDGDDKESIGFIAYSN
uniref:ANK_REP_REGION domain-containing protein n=1 Tax=Anopheles epiroticus TaxID=199890 RepID=A0A182PMH7_9DIPT